MGSRLKCPQVRDRDPTDASACSGHDNGLFGCRCGLVLRGFLRTLLLLHDRAISVFTYERIMIVKYACAATTAMALELPQVHQHPVALPRLDIDEAVVFVESPGVGVDLIHPNVDFF